MSLEPANATVNPGNTTMYDVVVEDASGGVGAYNFTVSIADSSVASITDVRLGGEPADKTIEVTIAGDGSSTTVVAALADTPDSGSVTIGTVTVSGDAAGTSDLALTVEALGTEAGVSYTVSGTNDASVTVEAVEEPEEPPTEMEYTRDEISQAKYGLPFDELSTETTGQVQAIYNRQPFPDGTTPADIKTREQLAESMFGIDVEGATLAEKLNREQMIRVQNAYDAQFGDA